jgi:hypothetical protein
LFLTTRHVSHPSLHHIGNARQKVTMESRES